MGLFLISLINLGTWGEFGLVGVAFGTLATLLWRVIKKIDARDKTVVDIEFVKNTFEELSKRDTKFIELQEKTIEAMNKQAIATEKLIMRLEDIEQAIVERDYDDA